jgi:hypothetical protein
MRRTTSNRMTLSSQRLKRLALSLDMVVRLILLRPLPLGVGQSIRTTLLNIDKDYQKEGRCGTEREKEGETGIVVARSADDCNRAHSQDSISIQVCIGRINRSTLTSRQYVGSDNRAGTVSESEKTEKSTFETCVADVAVSAWPFHHVHAPPRFAIVRTRRQDLGQHGLRISIVWRLEQAKDGVVHVEFPSVMDWQHSNRNVSVIEHQRANEGLTTDLVCPHADHPLRASRKQSFRSGVTWYSNKCKLTHRGIKQLKTLVTVNMTLVSSLSHF